MREPPKFWPKDHSLDGLLFFAQAVESMLFDFAPDSYRVPTLTTFTRAKEAIIAMHRIKHGEIPEGVLPAMIEELRWSIKKDPVCKKILGGRIDYVESFFSNTANIINFEKGCSYLIRNIEEKYEKTCFDLLHEEIKSGKNKDKIYKLSEIYCNILITKYSKSYIYRTVRENYLTKKPEVIPDFEKFVSGLPKEETEFEVFCRLSSDLIEFFERLDIPDWKITKRSDIQTSDQRMTKQFFGENPDVPFLRLTLKSKEPEEARALAERLLVLFKGVLSSLVHKHELSWEPQLFARKIGEKNGWVIDKPLSEMFKRTDVPFHKAISLFHQKLRLLFGAGAREENTEKLMAWFINHDAALQSPRVESQLVTLWSSLEVLMPKTENVPKIVGYINNIIPCLMISYVKRRYLYVFSAMKYCYRNKFMNEINELEYDGNLLDKFCLVVSDHLYEGKYEKLINLSRRNPLMTYRLNELREKFAKPADIKKRIQEHENKLRWHIQRIYRERNNIVHAGVASNNAELLTVHLHEYCDAMIETLDSYLPKKTGLRDLRYVFGEVAIDYNLYLECLGKIGSNDPISHKNFRAVFGLVAIQPRVSPP